MRREQRAESRGPRRVLSEKCLVNRGQMCIGHGAEGREHRAWRVVAMMNEG